MMWLQNLLEPRLKPIEIGTVSVDKISDHYVRTTFEVKFRMGSYLARGMYFNTKGRVETDAPIDKQTLIRILETTDLDQYTELNMKKRNGGNFDYRYKYQGTWLTINFETF